ncbi:MAG: hypothetical protein JHC95_18930 [Solirubrobacteraceae bacterium]|nr:hypothetical protein [Solirubrobacteraceae bacterium]
MSASRRSLATAVTATFALGLLATPAGSQSLFKSCGSFTSGEKAYSVQGYEIEQVEGTDTGKANKLDKATCKSAGKALKSTLKKSGTYNGWACVKQTRQSKGATAATCDYTPAANSFWRTRAVRTK